MFREVHLGHKKLHSATDVGGQSRGRAERDRVVVLAQPGFQPVGLFSGQDDNVVLTNRVFGFDRHPQGFGSSYALHPDLTNGKTAKRLGHAPCVQTRIWIVILHQTRGRVGVEMLNDLGVNHPHHLALKKNGHRHNQGKFLGLTPVVVDHGQDSLIVIADNHDLRG